MNEFNPGAGWREVWEQPNRTTAGDRYLMEMTPGGWRYWVREEPTLPLPTEPYTVIRVTWKHGSRGEMNHDGGLTLRSAGWVDVAGHWIGSSDLMPRITGFEVLSEPRAVTAKAVLDDPRIADCPSTTTLDAMRREFGIES